ncbi:MAG: hypothetical protein K8H88_12020 [Sandaracinaceae bacterium]|nr:hypothetical protein [Sandaracinaceae bacterium]
MRALILSLAIMGCCPPGHARFVGMSRHAWCEAPSRDEGHVCAGSDECEYSCGCVDRANEQDLRGACTRYPPRPGHHQCLIEHGRRTGIIVD